MFSHLRYRGPRVEARSIAGKWTVELLDLNDDASIVYRSGLMSNLSRLTRDLNTWEEVHAAIRLRLDSAKSQDQKERLSAALREAEDEIKSILEGLKLIIPDVENT